MRYVLLVLSVLFLFTTSEAQGSWSLKKDKEGIKIYTRKKEGSKFKEFKATTQLKTTVSTLVAVLKDKSAYKELFPLTIELQVLEQRQETYQVQYVKTDVPFPVTDRDGVYEFKYQFNQSDKSVEVWVKSVPGRVPRDKKMVRITDGEGFWKFVPKENGFVEIIYQFHAEPGGSIPAWLANSQVVDSPWQAMTGLLRMAKKEKYQNTSFQFMQ